MEDDYQSTLKGKVEILYQLEKWQDVIKLCEQYNEKYGKDAEIDMMRFKSGRHLNKTTPAEENKARIAAPESPTQEDSESAKIPEGAAEEEPLLLLTKDQEAVQNQAMIVMDENHEADEPLLLEEKVADEPFPQTAELLITDPFAEDKSELTHAPYEPYADADELIITDPFAENDPMFSLADNEPPVILNEKGNTEDVETPLEMQAEEIAIVEESPDESAGTKISFDFKSNPAMAFDAEPTLAPAPEAGPIAARINDAEKKPPAGPLVPDSVILDKSVEVWQEIANSADRGKAAEGPRPMSEPDDNSLKKPKSPPKITFNFKYFLLLVLPLAAAGVLWLSLSGKLNLNGGGTENISPAHVDEPRLPAAKRLVRKVTPAVQIPRIDENEKLVNEKISQANNLFKEGDVLNALTVVLEAKKIKMTEPLRQLEELITKKILEDKSRAEEQKQAVQNMAQSEDQVYAEAETENTIAAWQNFLLQYPQSEFAPRVRNKIVVFEKKAAQKVEQEFQLKIQQAQKLKLRFDYMNLNQAEVNAALQQLGKPTVQFEQLEHGGEKVIVDFSSGLMWTLWNKPMVFDKAKWWANRIYAGYAGWRLPTIVESLSLLQMDKTLYANLADFAVWTGDGVSDQVRSIWVLRLPQGQLIPENYSKVYYVWAVRKAGK